MLEQLKRFDPDRASIDEMLALAVFATGLRTEYERRNITAPEWLDDKIRTLNREIESHRRDALEMRLKEIRAQKTQLLTPTEKRAALQAEEEALAAQLATAK
jgi:hypothetical protein